MVEILQCFSVKQFTTSLDDAKAFGYFIFIYRVCQKKKDILST